jgi:hypothetical protein
MSVMTRRAAFGNVHQPGTADARHRTINSILDAASGGVATFNEAALDHAYLQSAADSREMSVISWGELAIAYARDLVLVYWNYFPISPGGYIGADGVATPRKGDDDRRVGPGRGLLIAVFYDPARKKAFFRGTSHDLAKAGTTAKWRQGLLFGGWRRTAAAVNQIIDDVPNGSIDGDKNWNKRVNYPDTPDTPVFTPPTFGRSHYDQISEWGRNISIGPPAAVNTPSDHDMLRWTFTISGPDVEKPYVDVSKPSATVPHIVTPTKHRPTKPVRFPWRRRSRLWKRRHAALWRRIVVWRRHNPRRG